MGRQKSVYVVVQQNDAGDLLPRQTVTGLVAGRRWIKESGKEGSRYAVITLVTDFLTPTVQLKRKVTLEAAGHDVPEPPEA